MYGRYGTDELYMFMSILSLVLVVADVVLQFVIKDPLAKGITGGVILAAIVALLVIATVRSMSRKVYKRRLENERFLRICNALKRFFTFNTSSKTKSHNQDTDVYIFRDCTKCRATLRLPRKKGRHKVRCPKCAHGFYVRSK